MSRWKELLGGNQADKEKGITSKQKQDVKGRACWGLFGWMGLKFGKQNHVK
jgi:hypothetical protein